jgi:hypothetical protein
MEGSIGIYNNTANDRELFKNTIFEAVPPEVAIAVKSHGNLGSSAFIGTGITTENKFYFGVNGKVVAKLLEIREENKDLGLFDSNDGSGI